MVDSSQSKLIRGFAYDGERGDKGRMGPLIGVLPRLTWLTGGFVDRQAQLVSNTVVG